MVGLTVIGLTGGLSPFFSGYYDATSWVPIGLGTVVVAAALTVARPVRFNRTAALATVGLLGLGIWSISSAAWAQSVENAVVDGNRWLVYGAFFVLLLTLLGDERRCSWLLGAAGLGLLVVGVSVLARLLGGDPASLFYMGRLDAPLGYINGEGCLFVMGFWLCWAAAERGRTPVAAIGAGAATLLACLALLSQSRGTALAMTLSFAAVVIALPGRSRRLPGLLLVAAGVGLARTPLLAVYQHAGAGGVPAGVGHAAGRSASLAALGVGIAWAVVVVIESRLTAADPGRAARLRPAGAAVLAVLLLGGVIAAAAFGPRLEHTVASQWRAFTHLSENGDANSTIHQPGQSRLLSGGGYRYDYWRIAWNAWRADPVIGIGAGNYDRVYFARRATAEDIRQPHSIELQTLSELGLVGGALLLALVVGAGAGVTCMRAKARASARTLGLLVAALGASVSWFVQTSVDWMHLLPGVTAIALAAIAVLVSSRGQPEGGGSAVRPPPGAVRVLLARRLRGGRTAGIIGSAAVAGALVLAGASLSRQGLADLYRARAQSDLATDPRAALREASRSLSFDSDAVASYYAKAAALARFDDAAAARDALRAALQQEPNNFVTWTLLGDIAVRQGRLRAAQADYSRALALNPRDSSLIALAVNPRAAVP